MSGKKSEAKNSAQPQTAEAKPVRGMFTDVPALYDAFDRAARRANLLTPVTRIDYIPPLHGVSLRVVKVDPRPPAEGDPGGGDVYQIEGRLALTKRALDSIAAAAGISWRADLSGRLDDGSDPHYCRYRAVAVVTDFDGQCREAVGEKEVDLRDGSGTIRGWSPKRLKQAREHIQSICESKAKNRAIRSLLALKASYTLQEVRLPFVVPKLVFTGQTDDADLRRAIAQKIAERALGLTNQLYGPPPQQSQPVLQPAAAPPPAVNPDAVDDDETGLNSGTEPPCNCPDGPIGRHLAACSLATPENSPKGEGGRGDGDDIPF